MRPLRRAVALALTAGLLALAGAGLAGDVRTRATPWAGRAVVSLAPGAGAETLHGTGARLLQLHQHVGVAVVRGDAAALARVAARPGVRSIAPDVDLVPASGPLTDGDSVFAWERLGGAAGRPGAGSGVTVAIVDTGVSDTPALDRASGRLVDGVDTSGEGTWTDGYGHGTFMANVLAGGPVEGTGNRGLGVAPGATVVNVKVADASGTTSLARVVEGFDWVLAHADGVDVVSFSFAGDRPGPEYAPDPLTDAVDRVRAAGVTVVVSAGNDPDQVGDPGFHPWVLTVGAADVRPGRAAVAAWSGRAVVDGVTKPDLVASGVNVLSMLPPTSAIATAHPQARHGAFWRGSGTSQATAQAAGAAALYLSAYGGASPAEVKAALRRAARPVAGAGAGAGLLTLTLRRVVGPDGSFLGGSGTVDPDGWAAGSWSAGSWSAGSWSANSWSASSWSASTWSRGGSRRANSWSGMAASRAGAPRRANSWSANSWSNDGTSP